MNRRFLILVLVFFVVSAVGCQRPFLHSQLELMNAEMRALENELYTLQFDYEEALRQIDKLKRQNERLHGGESGSSSKADRSSVDPGRSSMPSIPAIDLTPPIIEDGILVEPKIEPRIEPKIEPAPPAASPAPSIPSRNPQDLPAPRGVAPSPSPSPPRSSSNTVPPVPPVTPSRPSSASSELAEKNDIEISTRVATLEPGDPRVTHLHLNPTLIRLGEFDEQPGADGLMVVIEPRNRDEAFVPLAGPLSILILDPAKSAEGKRVLARWEFDANAAQRMLKNSPPVHGIELRLPWPDPKPTLPERVELHVRYLTVDHRDLRAKREISLTAAGERMSQQWTPRGTSRRAAAALEAPADSSSAPIETARPQWRPIR